MTKLLATGKTDLLEGFVSNKTRRKFKAYLAYDKKEGKVSFEFEPRAVRPGKTGAKPAAPVAEAAARSAVPRAGKATAAAGSTASRVVGAAATPPAKKAPVRKGVKKLAARKSPPKST